MKGKADTLICHGFCTTQYNDNGPPTARRTIGLDGAKQSGWKFTKDKRICPEDSSGVWVCKQCAISLKIVNDENQTTETILQPMAPINRPGSKDMKSR